MPTEQDMFTDEYWMQKAIELAEQARDNDEVPVGAIVVSDNQVIGEGRNQPIGNHDPSAHADCQTLRFMSHWNHALCVQVQLFNHEFKR